MEGATQNMLKRTELHFLQHKHMKLKQQEEKDHMMFV